MSKVAPAFSFVLMASLAHASPKEYQIGASAELVLPQGFENVGYGGSLSLRYGLEHFLVWEIAGLAWRYLGQLEIEPGAKLQQRGASLLRLDLHRLELTSTLVFQLPLKAQVAMRGFIPQLGVGLGGRVDTQTNRFSLSPLGASMQSLPNRLEYAPIALVHAGVKWRCLDSFALLAQIRSVFSPLQSGSRWGFYLGGAFSFLFYPER